MIDWGLPRAEDKRLRLEDYVLDFIPECIALTQKDSGEDDVSVVGYCMGGLLAVLYAALNPGGPLKNLVCFTTPVNFQGMELFSLWTDKRYFDVDRVVDALGNVPPELLVAAFDMLRPASKVAGQVKLWDNMWNDDFVKSFRMFDRWANDQIPFPGECFRQLTKELMWEDRLLNDEFTLDGRPVHLRDVTVPFIHLMAEHDHIVPQAASAPLAGLIGSEDKREVVLKGGHVSLVAGGNAVYRLWPQVDSWLAERSV
jgi:polyhydroxyalkanoate synthase